MQVPLGTDMTTKVDIVVKRRESMFSTITALAGGLTVNLRATVTVVRRKGVAKTATKKVLARGLAVNMLAIVALLALLSTTGSVGADPPVQGSSSQVGELLSPSQRTLSVPYALRFQKITSFPPPDYDSGWVDTEVGEWKKLWHFLGGDPEDYVVDMWFKDELVRLYGINQLAYGGREAWGVTYGASWCNLTDEYIELHRYGMGWADRIRVRIWRTGYRIYLPIIMRNCQL